MIWSVFSLSRSKHFVLIDDLTYSTGFEQFLDHFSFFHFEESVNYWWKKQKKKWTNTRTWSDYRFNLLLMEKCFVNDGQIHFKFTYLFNRIEILLITLNHRQINLKHEHQHHNDNDNYQYQNKSKIKKSDLEIHSIEIGFGIGTLKHDICDMKTGRNGMIKQTMSSHSISSSNEENEVREKRNHCAAVSNSIFNIIWFLLKFLECLTTLWARNRNSAYRECKIFVNNGKMFASLTRCLLFHNPHSHAIPKYRAIEWQQKSIN